MEQSTSERVFVGRRSLEDPHIDVRVGCWWPVVAPPLPAPVSQPWTCIALNGTSRKVCHLGCLSQHPVTIVISICHRAANEGWTSLLEDLTRSARLSHTDREDTSLGTRAASLPSFNLLKVRPYLDRNQQHIKLVCQVKNYPKKINPFFIFFTTIPSPISPQLAIPGKFWVAFYRLCSLCDNTLPEKEKNQYGENSFAPQNCLQRLWRGGGGWKLSSHFNLYHLYCSFPVWFVKSMGGGGGLITVVRGKKILF